MAVLRISAKTNLFMTSRAIVAMIHNHQHAELQAIGRSAVQHAEQAIAKATAYLSEEGVDIVAKARVMETDVDGNEKAGLRFIIEPLRKPYSSE